VTNLIFVNLDMRRVLGKGAGHDFCSNAGVHGSLRRRRAHEIVKMLASAETYARSNETENDDGERSSLKYDAIKRN
jgi:hypothetical protein